MALNVDQCDLLLRLILIYCLNFYLKKNCFRLLEESNLKTQTLENIVNDVLKKFEPSDYFNGKLIIVHDILFPQILL